MKRITLLVLLISVIGFAQNGFAQRGRLDVNSQTRPEVVEVDGEKYFTLTTDVQFYTVSSEGKRQAVCSAKLVDHTVYINNSKGFTDENLRSAFVCTGENGEKYLAVMHGNKVFAQFSACAWLKNTDGEVSKKFFGSVYAPTVKSTVRSRRTNG